MKIHLYQSFHQMYSHNIFFNVHIQNTLVNGREKKQLYIQNVKFFKNLVILKFKNIDNINDIEKYKGKELWIPREEAQDLEEDEYYIADLIGMKIVTEDGTSVGILKDVMETGANDVYVVQDAQGKELLLPACIQKNIFKIRKAFCIRCRIYLYFSSHTMCGSDHTYF